MNTNTEKTAQRDLSGRPISFLQLEEFLKFPDKAHTLVDEGHYVQIQESDGSIAFDLSSPACIPEPTFE